VAVGLDARAGDVAVRGWEEASGRSVLDVAREFEAAGIAALIVTDIGRDGTLEGPDVDGLGAVLAATSVDVIASGGVGALADLERLRGLEAGGRRLSGAIVGRALYEGAFTLDAALVASVGG
jgi:phosphoribosylformimino-5-aminoimidazole carboxamide ribotide isomerase